MAEFELLLYMGGIFDVAADTVERFGADRCEGVAAAVAKQGLDARTL